MGGAKGEDVGVRDMSGRVCLPGVEGSSEEMVEGGAAVTVVVACTSRLSASYGDGYWAKVGGLVWVCGARGVGRDGEMTRESRMESSPSSWVAPSFDAAVIVSSSLARAVEDAWASEVSVVDVLV